MSFLSLNRVFAKRSDPREAAIRIARFLKLPEHRWIASDQKLLDRFADFLSMIPAQDLKLILETKRLLLFYSNQKMSCAFYQFTNREVVLLFPDLKRLLLSSQYREAYAILAHELGHIFFGHSQKSIDPIVAQLEADRYAGDLGFAEELFRVLRQEHPSEEILCRLKYLRSMNPSIHRFRASHT